MPLHDDPLWYKDAILYELHVRAFRDSNADGMGDFRGLVDKLDYLRDLGVTAIWVLPFYPSPWRDDGYDIADYTSVHEAYGTLRDVRQFIKEAHARDLRVIGELVCNHTSDEHAWFQRARRAKPGSPQRDFYVWTDNPDKYKEARIIFKDFETSNWTWDPVAQQYYWHRFFHHQPDLNFDNPRVRQAVFQAMDFWLEMGMDGLRLDAIPYLYEREGTNCENLPETHAFLKELRQHIDSRFPNRMLLAEANQWPEDTIPYFGDGDECHMAFHFPLMPRLFMALRQEDRFPILDILAQTPPIPDAAQWALFLRNHDELTLEMVTDEERDYMWRVYANDPRMRINLGIRRRLAPLLGNDRRRIELMNALLFSMPGTPVLYYGDEIGMGDNIYLGDRNGVRTPMQWSADRNAGFSEASSQRLYLPVINDGEYSYETVNVEAQQTNLNSLWWWMRRLIALRKRHKAFGRGTLEFLLPDNRKALAYLRRHEDETILVVANLSRHAQSVTLDLTAWEGRTPVELFGGGVFPTVTQQPYVITLGPYAFYWFSLTPQRAALDLDGRPRRETPIVTARSVEAVFAVGEESALAEAVVSYMNVAEARPPSDTPPAATLVDAVPLSQGQSPVYLALVRASVSEDETETAPVALGVQKGEGGDDTAPGAAVAQVRVDGSVALIYDARRQPDVDQALVDVVLHHRRLAGQRGDVVGHAHGLRRKGERLAEPAQSAPTAYNVKLFRRVEPGPHPALETQHFLTERHFPYVAPLLGELTYQAQRGPAMTLGLLHAATPGQTTVRDVALDMLSRYYERALLAGQPAATSVTTRALLERAQAETPDDVYAIVGIGVETARLLGQRVAQLHAALAADPDNPNFAPEPFTSFYQRSIYQATRSRAIQVAQQVRARLASLPDAARRDAERVLEAQATLLNHIHAVMDHKMGGLRIRAHGRLRLDDILHTGNDVLFADFEGDPTRPLSERRIKVAPFRDVAGVLLSFHAAAHDALADQAQRGLLPGEALGQGEAWARFWYAWVGAAFLRAYLAVPAVEPLLPPTREECHALLDTLLLRQAVNDVALALGGDAQGLHARLREALDTLGVE